MGQKPRSIHSRDKSTCQYMGSILGLGRSPGKGNGNPHQYSCWENLIDREALRATVHGVAKSRTRLKRLSSSNAPTNPCYHIDAAYDCPMYYQLSNLFCLCPGQQATTCSASSTKICKTIADHGKPQMDMATKTLRPETSKRGRPNAPHHPVQQQVARKTSMPLFPKNWASHLLRGGC